MTDNFIRDATMDFIKANRDHVELALNVEEAVGELRARAIKMVLERVKTRLQQRFKGPQWRVVVHYPNDPTVAVCLFDEGWALKEYDKWEGVRLVANTGRSGWDHANISVSPPEEGEINSLRAWLSRRHDKTIGTPLLRSREWLYWTLPDDLADWNSAAFVYRAHQEPDEIVDRLTTMVCSVADSIKEGLAAAKADAVG